MSLALVTTFAPFLRSCAGPALYILVIGPGTANTSRPCSAALRAVISEPLSSAPSVTTTPLDNPLTIRFLAGNIPLLGRSPKGISDMTAPPPSIIW